MREIGVSSRVAGNAAAFLMERYCVGPSGSTTPASTRPYPFDYAGPRGAEESEGPTPRF